jgi:hypothetical protein
MIALRDLQRELFHALTANPGRSSADSELMAAIEPSRTQTPEERLQVYVDAYYWRLVQALREIFPCVSQSVSSETFATLVHDYLRQHPSEHPSVSYVGRRFADFLDGCPEVPPYAADLARLEWARSMVFEAPDIVPISVDGLRQIAPETWPGVCFETIAGLQVIECAWPVHLAWNDTCTAITAEPTTLRVWRAAQWKVVHAVVGRREQAALQRLRNGEPFAAICEAYADLPQEEAAQGAMGSLLRWVEDGIIATVR